MELFNPKSHIDFMHLRTFSFVLSLALIALAIIFIVARGINWGLDFTGGSVVELQFQEDIALDPLRQQLQAAGFEQALVQHYGALNDVIIRLGPAAVDATVDNEEQIANISDRVLATIRAEYPDVELMRADVVGAQIGAELAQRGIIALIVAVLLTAVYIAFRFEYRFAISAAVALAHDPLIILGLFALFQFEFDLPTLAAVLAAIGYSLNDTIVIFDRVRENFIKMRKATPLQVMNASINQTLSRTIITSGLTLIVILVLLFAGGQTLFGFSLALCIGIIVGTYSSIYVAGTLAIALGLSRQDLLPPEKEGADELVHSK